MRIRLPAVTLCPATWNGARDGDVVERFETVFLVRFVAAVFFGVLFLVVFFGVLFLVDALVDVLADAVVDALAAAVVFFFVMR